MKTLATGFQAHLDSGSTRLCSAIRITRRDAEVFGFTDHAETVTVDGTDCEPTSAYSGSAIESRADLAPSNSDLMAALDSVAITKADLLGGVWDDAAFELLIVNYETPAQYAQIGGGWLGEVSVGEIEATVEARGIASALQQRFGEVLSAACRADLGDAACGVALAGFTATGAVTSVTSKTTFRDSSQAATGLEWGLLTWATGAANAGAAMEVKQFTSTSGEFSLAAPLRFTPATGDGYSVYAGCNKLATSCRDDFSNIDELRGEIFLTGSDDLGKFGRQ